MARIVRIAGSFAIVLAMYSLYTLVAVPLIEPSAGQGRAEQITDANRRAARSHFNARLEVLSGMFPPGAWQTKNPKIIESDRVKLLMQDYENLGNGRIALRPCTIIFAPDVTVTDPEARARQAVILEAPDGAELEFDRPFELRSMKIGRLEGGRLKGRITIRSKGKKPEADDDLWIVTRDVELTEKNVWTPHTVDFRLGPHYGRGSGMRIKLLAGDDDDNDERRGPDIAGVEFFEMEHVEGLHLELPAEGKSSKTAGAKPRRAVAPGVKANLPVEINCRGKFQFDVVHKVATFNDRVDVKRIHPTGPVDQLNCQQLSVHFTERRPPAPNDKTDPSAKKRRAGSLDLKPHWFKAVGYPVKLSAPSEQLAARGEILKYDLLADRIDLEGTREVMVQQGANEIRARSLHYQSAGPGRLGQLLARGPGWLSGRAPDGRATKQQAEPLAAGTPPQPASDWRGQTARGAPKKTEKPGEPFSARWNTELRLYPQERNQVISLTGGAELNYGAIGHMSAGEIHFWLLESPKPGADMPELRPDRMCAINSVVVDSANLSARIEKTLEVWFVEKSGARGQGAGVRRQEAGGRDQGLAANRRPSTADRRPPTADRPAPKSHFRIDGRLLQARVVVGEDSKSELSWLLVKDNVQFVETQTAKPDERPLVVQGDWLRVVDADKPHAAVTVVGRPAHFEGRGLGLTGTNINLNRGTNRLWIDGPGQMEVPIDRDLDGKPLAEPDTLDVQWHRGMDFDGRTAKFEESITAGTTDRLLQTETLEVQFHRPVDFGADKIDQQPNPERILCHGDVLMESRTLEQGKQISLEKMSVADLDINLLSGAMTARGPGRLNSVRSGLGDFGSTLVSNPTAADAKKPAGDPDDDEQLGGLHVRFLGSISGNLKERQVTFHDQVQTAYAPVSSWQATLDPNTPDALGPERVVMRCEAMTVTQMTAPVGKRQSMELVATGNPLVEGMIEGEAFSARAIRMTYAEAKDLLVLEGNGRTKAILFRQERVGGPFSQVSARTIHFRPKTGNYDLNGFQSMELGQFPIGNQKKR